MKGGSYFTPNKNVKISPNLGAQTMSSAQTPLPAKTLHKQELPTDDRFTLNASRFGPKRDLCVASHDAASIDVRQSRRNACVP